MFVAWAAAGEAAEERVATILGRREDDTFKRYMGSSHHGRMHVHLFPAYQDRVLTNFAEIAAPLVTETCGTETCAEMEEVGVEQASDTEVETSSDE